MKESARIEPSDEKQHIPAEPAGWIFFDSECRFCVNSRRRWGPVFERRGFTWLPLQTPGTAERLRITPAQLNAEIWLLPSGGAPVSGVKAWLRLMRHVWWLRPLARILSLPGFRTLAEAAYRWIARNRKCLSLYGMRQEGR